MAWKWLNLPKIGKGCLNLGFFLWFTHLQNYLCETDWNEVGKDVKDKLKFYKNELRLWFHCYILIPRKCPRKTLFQHTVPPVPLIRHLCRHQFRFVTLSLSMHTYTVHTMINFRKYHVGTAENQNGTTIAQFFSSHGLVVFKNTSTSMKVMKTKYMYQTKNYND